MYIYITVKVNKEIVTMVIFKVLKISVRDLLKRYFLNQAENGC
jgi:hypothetical protein